MEKLAPTTYDPNVLQPPFRTKFYIQTRDGIEVVASAYLGFVPEQNTTFRFSADGPAHHVVTTAFLVNPAELHVRVTPVREGVVTTRRG